ncbi:APC family permease [Picrophilus oshimae]|uniref:Amino acid permease n=1 Tax=Picrophilus torridus (strain ATCC 700027 / DSM 9790 / JCM 10055 / NBRC 100828 / KAW 2/3) TaxID=1122961 RepID=Q6L2Q0_PICTO|nr:APC family permease [Picrophilus oshimae]AAT42752.1 amino acid permease [Picrophilus oshimae DSM 9789]
MEFGSLRENVHKFNDLIALSVSSVAPAFSIAASYGVIFYYLRFQSLLGIIIAMPFFLLAALIFKKFNRSIPNAGASYVWGKNLVSDRYGRFQSWIVSLAYFFSIPPIVIPAGEYTMDLLKSFGLVTESTVNLFLIGSFWILISFLFLALGARPTSRATEIFIITEITVILIFLVLAIKGFPEHYINKFSFSWVDPLKIKRPYMFIAGFLAIATIMDGWEIDSYASEESMNKNRYPGTTGIIGLIFVFIIYIITMTLMEMETPAGMLSLSDDPLFAWASYISDDSWIMLIAVISSTASSLWLTTYILSRAWYSMARDGIMFRPFGYIDKRGSPLISLIIIALLTEIVNAVMLFIPSVENFFAELLSLSGAFLLAEFCMDGFTGLYFFSGKNHHNRFYILISAIVFSGMLLMIILGFYTNINLAYISMPVIIPGIIIAIKNVNLRN